MYLAVYATFLLLAISSCNCFTVTAKGIDISTCGSPDWDAIHTIAHAHQAGIRYVDVYMFPCPRCNKSATVQVEEMVKSLNISYAQIWLDIEGSQYWTGSHSSNQRFYEELLSAASRFKPTGVYTSEYQWSDIMGSGYTGGSDHQLWYAHYDNDSSFSDFEPFGGWSKPNIKQYAQNEKVCGVEVNLNYY